MARRVNREQSHSVRALRRIAEAPLGRPLLVIVPLVAILVGAVAPSFSLLPRYRSTTLILVAPESTPCSFVQTMTTEKIEADFLDPTSQDTEELSEPLSSYPVLAVIPYGRPRMHHRLARGAEPAIRLARSLRDGDAQDSGGRRLYQGTGITKAGPR